MQSTIESVLDVAPSVFWERIFFDDGYNDGLYAVLGFERYTVLAMERRSDGSIVRSVRAEPPIVAPDFIRRALEGKLHYVERGTYDAATGVYALRTTPSVMPDHVGFSGRIHATPTATGSRHRCDLDVKVDVWGLGAMVERIIERNTRDSFAKMVAFTNEWAREQGLSMRPAAE